MIYLIVSETPVVKALVLWDLSFQNCKEVFNLRLLFGGLRLEAFSFFQCVSIFGGFSKWPQSL